MNNHAWKLEIFKSLIHYPCFQLTVKSVFGRNGANALQPAEMEQKQEIGT